MQRRDGSALAAALDPDARAEPLISQLRARAAEIGPLCARALPEPYDELLGARLHALGAAAARNFSEAFTQQEACLSAAHRVFQENGADWLLPVIQVVDRAIRRLALQADAQLRGRGEKADRLQEAARILNRSFTITITDRAPLETSKKWGALAVINELFKVRGVRGSSRRRPRCRPPPAAPSPPTMPVSAQPVGARHGTRTPCAPPTRASVRRRAHPGRTPPVAPPSSPTPRSTLK